MPKKTRIKVESLDDSVDVVKTDLIDSEEDDHLDDFNNSLDNASVAELEEMLAKEKTELDATKTKKKISRRSFWITLFIVLVGLAAAGYFVYTWIIDLQNIEHQKSASNQYIPASTSAPVEKTLPFVMTINKAEVGDRTVTIDGKVEQGSLQLGDPITVEGYDKSYEFTITSMQMGGQNVSALNTDDTAHLILSGDYASQVRAGQLLVKAE